MLRTKSNGIGKARGHFKLYIEHGNRNLIEVLAVDTGDNETKNILTTPYSFNIPNIPNGSKIYIFGFYLFENRRGLNSGSIDVETRVNNFSVDISTKINS